jgi:hypothetical protein
MDPVRERPTMPVITLLTDYGGRDYYVGALKGVILGIAPNVRIVDITHDVEPHNILQGAFVLWQIWPWYPPGTIHVAVVDPGVGSDRRIILGQYAGRYVVAPDNGLITLLHREIPAEAMYIVENRRFFTSELSATFHGRDIMAPVAAHLANGVKPKEFGRVTDRLETLPVAEKGEIIGDAVRGTVLYVDRFGTLVTNIRREQLAGLRPDAAGLPSVDLPASAGRQTAGGTRHAWTVLVNGLSIGPIRSAFFEVPQGEPVALIGGSGHLEIAINQGRAVERFGPAHAVVVEVLAPPDRSLQRPIDRSVGQNPS